MCLHINYYNHFHQFFSVQLEKTDSVNTFIKEVKEKGHIHDDILVILKNRILESNEIIGDLINDLCHDAIYISNEPALKLILPNTEFNLADYHIEKIEKHCDDLFKAIDGKTNQKVFIKAYEDKSSSDYGSLTRGIYIMSLFNIPSIPKILNYCFSVEGFNQLDKFRLPNYYNNILVTEYLGNGSVKTNVDLYLKSNGREHDKMNPTIRSKIIFGVAATLKQMHQKGIVHLHLRMEDIMLNDDLEPVISDFRFARFITGKIKNDRRTYDEFISDAFILPPELFTDDGSDSGSPHDVYSFSIFLYKMFSTDIVMKLSDGRIAKKLFQIFKMVVNGLRPPKPDNIPDHYWELIERCWNGDPLQRPTFKEIVDILRDDKYAIEEFGMKTDLTALHEYQDRIDVDESREISNLKAEIAKLKKKISTLENPQPKTIAPDFTILDSDTIRNLRTIREISIGGFGRVLEVGKEKVYALKIMHKTEDFDVEKLRSFLAEYELLNQLKHPNIVHTYGIYMGDENNPPSILLEFCVCDMKAALKDPKNTNEMIITWIYQIVEAMKYVHSRGIVHRDLKPQNILIGKDGQIRVSDFGISKLLTAEEQSTTLGAGTQNFMAPEILKVEKYNEKADVYSFGVLLYFILSKGQMPKINIIQVGNGVKAKIPDSFTSLAKEVIDKCWNYSPQDRPSFDQILQLFDKNDYKLFNVSNTEIKNIKTFVKEHKKKIPK